MVAAACVGLLSACGNDDDTAPEYDVVVAVVSEGRFGALQLDITHLGYSGGFGGRGDRVDCVTLVSDALSAANYKGERVVSVGLISIAGIRTPAPILRCGFRTHEELDTDSFQIDVLDASGVGEDGGEPVDPPPTVVVTSVTPR